MRGSSWLASAPPAVAVEIATHRVTVVGVTPSGSALRVTGYASEALPEGTVVPALSGTNIPQPSLVTTAIVRALDRAGLGSVRRVALVVPDSIARVSLLPFEELPARQADFDRLVKWQVRKATPYPIEEAQVAHFIASAKGSSATIAAVVARRDVVTEYETAASGAGLHAGLVDLASLNVMNGIIGTGAAPAGDWLLVHRTVDSTTLAILRGAELMFYRHRTASDEEPLGSLVHQTAMYHEDRLGGQSFVRVWLSGAGIGADDVRTEISSRLGVPTESVDVRGAVELSDRIDVSAETLDAVAAPLGVLIRERKAA